MKTLKTLFLLVLLVLAKQGYSSHFLGYDMSVSNIPNTNTYKVRLLLYRDNRPGTAPMPTSFVFNTYVQGTNASANLNMTLNRTTRYVANFDIKNCLPPISTTMVEVGVFEYTITETQAALLSNTNGYYISSDFCCRNTGAINVVGQSSSYGVNFYVDIPKLSSGTYQYNSTPAFKQVPNFIYYVGTEYTFDWGCTDPNGDSLSYSLVTPTDGVNVNKPFATVPYSTDYQNGNIMDGSPDLTYNASTGIVNFRPTRSGAYLLAFKVKEWRKINGVWVNIGSIYRELQLETVVNPEVAPVLVDINNAGGIIRDTINVSDTATYFTKFITRDAGDSIFMFIQPEQGINNNILNSSLFDIQWGKEGGTQYNANDINNLVLVSTDSLKTTFRWNIDSTDVKKTPYKFRVITKDEYYCPELHADTLDFELYVLGECNSRLNLNYYGCDSVVDFFNKVHYVTTSTSDTIIKIIGCDSIINQKIWVYPTPISNPVIGDVRVLDTSRTYNYSVDAQTNVIYTWSIDLGKIVNGQGTNSIEVKFDSISSSEIKCMVYNPLYCSDSSTIQVLVMPVGVEQYYANPIKIIPNPAFENIVIQNLPTQGVNKLSIVNMQGELVFEQEVFENGKLDISNLAKGIYILKVSERVQKFIKL